MTNRQKFSVVIITFNEEQLIQRCLNSCLFADQVLVVDSESTDATVAIARRNGADVIVQPWLGYPQQRNFGGRQVKYDWILMLDADEVVTDELRQSIIDTLHQNPNPKDGFAVDRRAEFMGALLPNMRRKSKLLEHCRLYNRLHSAWDEKKIVHEDIIILGKTHLLNGALLHCREADLAFIINQNNKYSNMEADFLSKAGIRPSIFRMVTKPIARFVWCYFVCGAYKVGIRGFIYSSLKAFFDFLVYIKLWELYSSPVKPAHDVRNYIGNSHSEQTEHFPSNSKKQFS